MKKRDRRRGEREGVGEKEREKKKREGEDRKLVQFDGGYSCNFNSGTYCSCYAERDVNSKSRIGERGANDGIDTTSNRVDILMDHSDLEFCARLLLSRNDPGESRTYTSRAFFIAAGKRTQRVLIVIDRPSIFR